MRNTFLSLLLLVGSTVASAQSSFNTTTQQNTAPQDTWALFPALTSVSNTAPLTVVPLFTTQSKPGGTAPAIIYTYVPKYATVQAFVTGTPATCTYHVYGTLKFPLENPVFPTDYQDLTGVEDCTAPATSMVSIFAKPVVGIVISLTALTGGTSPAVVFRFITGH